MNTSVNEHDFTLSPNQQTALKLSFQYRKKAINSIKHIIETLDRVTGTNHQESLSHLCLLTNHKVSTELYVYNSTLVRLLTNEKDINGLTHSVSKLNDIIKHSLSSDKLTISNLHDNDWSIQFANDTVIDANRINGENYAYMSPLSPDEFITNCEFVRNAIAILQTLPNNQFYLEIIENISNIVLFNSRGVTGGSSARTMNAIFIRKPFPLNDAPLSNITDSANINELTPLIYYLEQLVHEAAHIHLDQLMEFDPIINNDPNDLYDSPIRRDKRPMRGVFHATYVLARISLLLQQPMLLTSTDLRCAKFRLNTINTCLANGIKILRDNALLTNRGQKIFNEICGITT